MSFPPSASCWPRSPRATGEARHAQKSVILDEFVAATGYARKYAIRLLRQPDPPAGARSGGHARRATARPCARRCEVAWPAANGICAKRLVPFLPELVPALERHGHLALTADGPRRSCWRSARPPPIGCCGRCGGRQPHGLSTTRPGPLLKQQIPMRTFAEWDDVAARLPRGRPGRPLRRQARGRLPVHADADRRRHRLDRVPAAAAPHASTRCIAGARAGAAAVAIPAARAGHRQRRRVPQRRAARLLRAGADHLHARAGRPTRTTSASSSRRTARSCANWSAMTASRASGPTGSWPSCTGRCAST